MSREVIYHLYSGNKIIGKFIMFNRNNLRVELDDNLKMIDIPIDFYPEYLNNQRVFDTKAVMDWIKDRVTPCNRHNIETLLERIGIEEYDPLSIFLYYDGRHTQDEFRIEKI